MKSIFCILILCLTSSLWSQSNFIGLQTSIGKQSIIPFNSGSYTYDFKSIGVYYKWRFRSKGRWTFHWRIQPTYYQAQHQLTNPWYKLDERDDAYARKIPQFEQPKTIREYALNVGFLPTFQIHPNIQLIGLANIGPMYSDTETERLARGIAFSDIAALGVLFQISTLEIGILSGIRHVSNANLRLPNNGHNASFASASLGFQIK